MSYSLFYSFSIHLLAILILILSQKPQLNTTRQYYIDFLAKQEVNTPQNTNYNEDKSNLNKLDRVKNKEQIENTKTKSTFQQVEDRDYLYTNARNIKPSMANVESKILESESTSGNETGITNQNTSSIRTDSNFPYPFYITKLRTILWENWQRREITSKGLKAVVSFIILKNGEIRSIKIDSPSGNELFDQSVIASVKEISRADPLPEEFNEDFLTVYVEFKTGN